MGAYIIRRLLYLIPIVFGVILITFILFNVVTTGDAIAKQRLGQHATQEQIDAAFQIFDRAFSAVERHL